MKQNLTILLTFFIISILSSPAQTIEYGYDACGNRIFRQIVLEKNNKALEAEDVPFSEEQLGATQVRIYPNPTHGHLKVVLQNTDETYNNSITIYSANGKQIANIPHAETETDIDISAQPNGIYLMRLCIGTEISTWKILKK